jgi:rod shape-determining protein MreC
MHPDIQSPRRLYGIGFLLFCAALTSIRIDSRQIEPNPLRAAVSATTAPIHRIITRYGQSFQDVAASVLATQAIQKENRVLNAKLSQLGTERARFERIETENIRLRDLLNLSNERKDLRLRMARVARKAASPYSRVIGLELDNQDGIKVGMPVVASGGLVGQVRLVSGTVTEVLLVTDMRSAVDVVLEKSGTRAIAVGSGDERKYRAHLKYVDRSESAIDGEKVLTTGDAGRFPEGLVLGTVRLDTRASRREISVVPTVNFETLDLVYLVLGTTGLTPDGRGYIEGKK